MPTWPGARHSRLPAPASLPSLAQPPSATTAPQRPHPPPGRHTPASATSTPPPWKDQLLGKEVWAFSICKTLRPGLEPLPPSFGGAFLRQRVEPWVFSGPIASPPDTPKPLAPTQETVSSTSPHGTLLINYSNSERKEERLETLKPWELVNQELKFKTNALSCGAPRHVFFFWQFC